MTRRIVLVLTVGVLMASLLIAVAAPAMAQRNNDNGDFFVVRNGFDDDDDRFFGHRFFDDGFENGFDQEAESGDIDLEADISNTGDNSNVCAPAAQFGNTGNVQNEQGFTSIGNGFHFDGDGFFDFFDNGDVEFEAEDQLVFEPSLETTCDQAVQQSAAASSWGWW